MTVSSDLNRISYTGNGTTTVFPVNYYFLEDSHLQVILITAAGVETIQTLTTNYTVTGAGRVTVFLLHGIYGSKEYWRPQTERLVARGYRVVARKKPAPRAKFQRLPRLDGHRLVQLLAARRRVAA